MIVVDNSVLIAIFEREPDAAFYVEALQQAERLLISAVNVHEIALVMRARRGADAVHQMWRFLQIENDFEIVAFDEPQVRGAIAAFERYGKGLHPRARLNLADCAAYALARSMNSPLLFKGGDFSETDIASVL